MRQNGSRPLLDASALLALVNHEEGAERVATVVEAGGTISAVNLAEVVSRLSEQGMPAELIHQALDPLGISIVDFDTRLAYQTDLLRPRTSHLGLSLGDRACLALAQQLGLPVLTADRMWEQLDLGVDIQTIR